MANIPDTNSFYEYINGDQINEFKQSFININLKNVSHKERVKISNFIIGADNDELFIDNIIKKIKQLSKNSEPFLLGPVYYDDKNIPTDFQSGFTETGKDNESFYSIANRGLIEEAGLCFKKEATYTKIKHSITRRYSYQDCETYLIHSSQLEPVKSELCDDYIDYFNSTDYIGNYNELTHKTKAQIFVYGTKEELDLLVKKINLKPVKQFNEKICFYDDDIRGLTIFSIKRLNRFRKKNI
jgi:hypothetical protein